jgi:hypothetical protein
LFAINAPADWIPGMAFSVNDGPAAAVEIGAGIPAYKPTGDSKMIKPLWIAVSAIAFSSAVMAASHTAAPGTTPSKEDKTMAKPAGSATKDASGKTEANKENKMSPTGQNETSSTSTDKKEGASSGSSSTKAK